MGAGDPSNGGMILKWGVNTPLQTMILAELLNVSKGVPFFQIVGRSHWWCLYLIMLGKGVN